MNPGGLPHEEHDRRGRPTRALPNQHLPLNSRDTSIPVASIQFGSLNPVPEASSRVYSSIANNPYIRPRNPTTPNTHEHTTETWGIPRYAQKTQGGTFNPLTVEKLTELNIFHYNLSQKYKGERDAAINESHELKRATQILVDEIQELETQMSALQKEKSNLESTRLDLTGALVAKGNSLPSSKNDDLHYVNAFERIFDLCKNWAVNLSFSGRFDSRKFDREFVSRSEKIVGSDQNLYELLCRQPANMMESLLITTVMTRVLNGSFLEKSYRESVLKLLSKDVINQEHKSEKTWISIMSSFQGDNKVQQELEKHLDMESGWILNNIMKGICLDNMQIPDDHATIQRRFDKRNMKLRKILGDAMKTFLEIRQEPATFAYEDIPSDTEFNPETMSALEDHNTDQKVTMFVVICASPIIWKRLYESQTATVLYKAKVYVRMVKLERPRREHSTPEEISTGPWDDRPSEPYVSTSRVAIQGENSSRDTNSDEYYDAVDDIQDQY